MLNEQTLSTLNALKLFGMAKSFSDKLSHPNPGDLSHREFFGLIVQDEKTYRENLRLKKASRQCQAQAARGTRRPRLQTPPRLKQTDHLGTLFSRLDRPSP